ncbi:Putative ribonuclease H protein At1g65750 [Linum perenne]
MCKFLNSENGTIFGNIYWFLWKSRNERIFAADRTQPAGVVARGLSWSSLVTDALRKTRSVLGEGSSRFEINLAWDPGQADWVTLNTDGSVDRGRRKASVGGMLRDSEGRCILAFTMNLGTCSITRAEMRGAIEGLKRTWEAGFRRVILQLDSIAAISLLSNAELTQHQHGLETTEFQELQRRDWDLEITHTYRVGNHAADYLASIGYGYPYGSHIVSISDCNLVYHLRRDCIGVSEPRLISIND